MDECSETKTTKPKKRNSRLGRPQLAENEPTARPTVNLPVSLLNRILERAPKGNISAYIRQLVEADLQNAV